MQTKEQIKKWKVVASAATIGALGVSGLAVASPNEPAEAPPPIEIQDSRDVVTQFVPTTVAHDFQVVPSPDHTLDSPLASADLHSTDATATAEVDDTPEVRNSPTSTAAPRVDDTAPTIDDTATPSVATPDVSVATPDTGDSLDT